MLCTTNFFVNEIFYLIEKYIINYLFKNECNLLYPQ